MPTATEPEVLDAAAAIVEGRTVDWDALAAHSDPQMLACLQDIAALAGAPQRGPATVEPENCERWAHLELSEEIGRGASGVVYRAFDPILRRDVALKLCVSDRADGQDLLREAQAMARVDHPGVLKVHGAARYAGRVGFWSDLIEGENLAQRIDDDDRRGAGAVCALGLELCTALAAIHAAGLQHGDVKAQNVVRRRDGRHLLVDFGSSVSARLALGRSGTPLYLAPELLAGATATAADDLYSLGVLLFRLLGGRFPCVAQSLDELLRQHADGQRLRLFDLRPDLPPRLIAAVEKAIDPRPAARYRSAGEFAADLHRALQVELPSSSASSPAAPPGRRRGRFWLGAALALLATAAVWHLASVPAAEPLRARLLKSSGNAEAALLDGDRLALGDTLALELQLSTAAFVYVVDEDAEGRVFQLFPLRDSLPANPLPARQRLRLPGTLADQRYDWQVSSSGGRERIYVVVARHAIEELDAHTGALTQAQRDAPIDRRALLGAQSPERGIGRLAPQASDAVTAQWPFGAWLLGLRQRDPQLVVRRFELNNP